MTIAAGLAPLVVPIARLRPLPGNPNRGDVAAVARSLAQFGQRKPVVARLSDDVVTAGNTTLLAARDELGWNELAVVFVDDDEATSVAWALADNRTAQLGSTNSPALLAFIDAIEAENAALLQATGWSDADIAELRAGLSEPVLLRDADEVPRSAPAVSRLGDVWLLGGHRVMCGSATDPVAVDKLMAGRLASSMVTDPPYGIGYGSTVEYRRRMGKQQRPEDDSHIVNDESAEAHDLWAESFPLWVPLLERKGSAVYCWAAAGPEQLLLGQALEDAGLTIHGSIVWVKSSFSFSRADHKYAHEPAWVAAPGAGEPIPVDLAADLDHAPAWYGWRSDGTHDWIGPNNETSVWEYPRPARSPDHPTQKPVDLIRRCIRNVTPFGGIVVDPFLGSGSAVLAAYLEARVCYGMELKPRYVDVICRRFQEATGIRPKLERTGELHDFDREVAL